MKSRHAIIDIGSNAIRAAVYEDHTLGAFEIYSDKFRSDIASLLEFENIDIKHSAYLTLQYFLNIFRQLRVDRVDCVATAILRNNKRGQEFADIIKVKFDINVNIISGEREAYLVAEGLISGISDANGVVADLGGGSLEIAEIHKKKVGRLSSLPLGTKFITKDSTIDSLSIAIASSLPSSNYEHLYLIGGAFRLIGKQYMSFTRYPLRILHNLEVSYNDFWTYLDKLEYSTRASVTYQNRCIDRSAILVAKALLKVTNPEKVVISNYGLKEGVRFNSLSHIEQAKDIITERCKKLTNFNDHECEIEEYHKLTSSLVIDQDDEIKRVIDLAIILVGFSKNIDRMSKANFVAEFILSFDAPFNHKHRLMLAFLISYALSSKPDPYINKLARKALSRKEYYNSQIVGNVMHIIREIDGPEFRKPSFSFRLHDKYIEIVKNDILPRVVFESVCERLKDIAHARKIVKYYS